ncbi:hypothetical protein [Maricaulis sp. CAU 1757]
MSLVDDALFHLAASGYYVAPDILRLAWLSRLDRRERQISASGRRRKDGVDGLLSAEPPSRLLPDGAQELNLNGVLQLFWELQRVYYTGKPVERDEVFALIDAAGEAFGANTSRWEDLELLEDAMEAAQAFFDREFEYSLVASLNRHSFVAAQTAHSRVCRALRAVHVNSGIGVDYDPVAIASQSVAFGPSLLKSFLFLSDIVGPRRLVLATRQFDLWALRAEFERVSPSAAAAMPTKRTRADLQRTCRAVFLGRGFSNP